MSVIARFIEARFGGKAELYERIASQAERAGVGKVRTRLARDLAGRVLEVGCGTGLNFPHYPAGAEVMAIEPVAEFRVVAEQRAAAAPARIDVVDGDARALGFADASFDAALATLVFCSVPQAPRALTELSRVVRRGGTVRFLEHVRSPRRLPALLQDVFNPLWCRAMDGCNLNRRTVELIGAAGFTVEAVRTFELPGAAGRIFPMVEVQAHVR